MNSLARPPCNDITIYRGNSADFVIKPVYENGEEVRLGKGDRILFTVRSRPDAQSITYFSKVFEKKDYNDKGELVLHLKPKDTVRLSVHTYWYDVAICFSDGTFYTFVPYSKFDILPTLGDVDMLPHHKDGGKGGKVHGKVQGVVEKSRTVYMQELEFKTYKEFPNIGEADKLYIATDEDTIYRFDAEQMVYKVVGGNPGNIKQIFCKLEEE